MAEQLLAEGYDVIGLTRNVDAARTSMPSELLKSVHLLDWEPSCSSSIESIIDQYRPNEVYNFAAYSSGSGMFDEPVSIGDINGLSVTRILEAIKVVDPTIRFCQASSREIFGQALVSPQTESTPAHPRSPYGAAKLYADAMVRIFREQYGLFATSAILYNHESPRRDVAFVSRKITKAVARIKLGLEQDLVLGNLETSRDWGYAGDYVRAMRLMLQSSQPDDYLIATGVLHSVKDLCQVAFSCVGLDYRDYVQTDQKLFRPSESFPLVGDSTKARVNLGWSPQLQFEDLISEMVENDLSLLEKGLL